ncbi:MAG TPA: triose-phosphate isomerase [Planctomycetota bacterium]|nr:triose-phosphate isomerase [Planctomycetota bacterium]
MTAAGRRPLIAANWKMNRGGPDGADLARATVRELGGRAPAGAEVALLPPSTALVPVADALRGTGVLLGAQDCAAEVPGAFTGDTAAEMLAAWGCALVLCGHSERRRLRGEDDAIVRAKVGAALRAGLRPVLCVGETAEERDAGRTAAVVARQAKAGVSGLEAPEAARLAVAYEPVWAIGTGRNAQGSDAAAMADVIRDTLGSLGFTDRGGDIPILYGGSVSSSNIAEFMTEPSIDGALVGGASLKPDEMAAIVARAGLTARARLGAAGA